MRAPKIGAYLWVYIFQTILWNQFKFSLHIIEPINNISANFLVFSPIRFDFISLQTGDTSCGTPDIENLSSFPVIDNMLVLSFKVFELFIFFAFFFGRNRQKSAKIMPFEIKEPIIECTI